MDAFKTYQVISNDDGVQSFSISRMEDIYKRRGGETDEPHRHNYFTVILVVSAKGKHVIDFNEYELSSSQIYFVSPGQVHQVNEDQESTGYAIVFSSQFLAENNIEVSFINNLNLFRSYGDSPPLEMDEEELTVLKGYAEEMIRIYKSNMKFGYQAIGALLKLLLIRCNNLCSLELTEPQHHTGHDLLERFKASLDSNFTQWHGASDYASDLNVTADHLNRVIKELTGKTTKEHIQSRITTAAKRMLYFSNLSNKEIAFELGFSEPAHFSAFFKKCTGISPSSFRESNVRT